ncbi:hypothetical protein GCM10028806_34060 [Spirosoma terrae]|uniref:Uncharacterized protein n=1 Tax=Spirosoma terrae TaxID=1968276 RepID=A0A6L9LGF0_9BACT|nr:hypothetical protein [Spirosoma terrae]NDU95719.1 hypothetical protein [Spirosoma terrae]
MAKHTTYNAPDDSVFSIDPNLKPLPDDHPVIIQKQEEYHILVGNIEPNLSKVRSDIQVINEKDFRKDTAIWLNQDRPDNKRSFGRLKLVIGLMEETSVGLVQLLKLLFHNRLKP